MSRRITTLALVSVTAASLVGTAFVSPASAGDTRALTKPEMMASLMKTADVPKNVRSAKTRSTLRTTPTRTAKYLSGADTVGPDLCFDKNGKQLNGRRPATEATAEITLESGGLNGVNMSTNNEIYNYGTPAKAQSAWRNLLKKARQCNGTVTKDMSEEGTSADVVVKTRFARTPALLGARGFTITADVSVQIAGEVDISVLGDQYAAYRVVGPAIERVEFAAISLDGSKVGINKERRAFTRSETDKVAQRVWVRWMN